MISEENHAGRARRGFFLLLWLCLLLPSGVLAYERNLNCGGPAYTATDGTRYLADQEYSFEGCFGFVGGSAHSTPANITGTSDPELYRTERRGVSQYKFDLPNGFYEVTLRFAETQFGYTGGRVFSVWIEGQRTLTDLDIYQQVGMNHALDYVFVVEVRDGQLNIQAEASAGQPTFSAICVKSLITPQPQELTLKGFDVTVGTNWCIAVNMSDSNDLFAAVQLQNHLATNCGMFLKLVDTTAMPGDHCILLANPHRDAAVETICSQMDMLPDSRLGKEGYLLEVFTNNLIIISANFPQGVFYGMQTLRQLLRGQKGVAYVRPVVYGHSGSTSNGNAMFDNFSLVDESVGGSSNMLLNPGFEDGFASYSYGGCVGISGAAAESGTNGVMFYDGGDIDGGFWQDCPAVGGKKYRTSIRARKQPGFDPAYLVLVLEFYDASYVQVRKTQTDIGNSLTTDWQTFTHWEIAPACTATVRAVRIRDWPDKQIRGVHLLGMPGGLNGVKAKLDAWAALKINAVIFSDDALWDLDADSFGLGRSNRSVFQELFAFCRQRHIEPIPEIGSFGVAGPLLKKDPHCAEGVWVKEEPFVFTNNFAEPVIRPILPLENPDFENDSNGDGVPDGWSFSPGRDDWSWDDTEAHSGTHSVKVSVPGPNDIRSNIISSQVMNAEADVAYSLSFWAKTEGLGGTYDPAIRVVELDSEGNWIRQHSAPVGSGYSTWQRGELNFFTATNCAQIYVYANIWDGYGTAWFDDLCLRRPRSALINVIRTDASDITITATNGNITYEENVDYYVNDGLMRYPYDATNAPTRIERIPEGRIAPGETVLVSYDYVLRFHPTAPWSVPYCPSEPRVYVIYTNALTDAIESLSPNYISLGHNEIRGMNRDSRCVKRNMTNGELLADDINRLSSHIHSQDPGIAVMVWDDMFNPWHNGGDENYQVPFGGPPGRTCEATPLIPKDIVMIAWWYDANDWLHKMEHTPEYFRSNGFNYVGAPWDSERNIRTWADILRDRPDALGIVDTTWWEHGIDRRWDGIEPAADYAWCHKAYPVASASACADLDHQPSQALDGDMDTSWCSDSSDTNWICIDFISAQTFDTVRLAWGEDFGRRYQIATSADGTNWVTVITRMDSTGGVELLNLGEQTARYVRMLGLESGTGHGYSLREFAVYAADADGDGLPDYWERRYFADLTNMTASSDVDGDGFPDWNEYVAGTDPTNALSRLEMSGRSEAEETFVVRWPSVSGKYYSLYRCTNLMNGFSLLEPNVRAAPPVNYYTDAVSGVGAAYYRIKVEQ